MTVGRKRQSRCGQCPGCISTDCNQCKHCLDIPNNGGLGLRKQCCIQRKCIRTAKAEADVTEAISRLHSVAEMYGKDMLSNYTSQTLILLMFHMTLASTPQLYVQETGNVSQAFAEVCALPDIETLLHEYLHIKVHAFHTSIGILQMLLNISQATTCRLCRYSCPTRICSIIRRTLLNT